MYTVKELGATPVIKWAGGKTKMIPELLRHMPAEFNGYRELFGGGLALYLHIGVDLHLPIIAESNRRLADMYWKVSSEPDKVMNRLDSLETGYNRLAGTGKELMYYDLRREFNSPTTEPIEIAALFIFLNKAGFNGLYRENAKGEMNVPWGKRGSVSLYDRENFTAASEIIRSALIYHNAFEVRVDDGDLVYADPPYYAPGTQFTSYSSAMDWSGKEAHIKLHRHLSTLADDGALVMATNADDPFIRALYTGWWASEVEMPRRISAKTEGRGSHKELILTSYNPFPRKATGFAKRGGK